MIKGGGHWYALLKAFVGLLDCLTIGLSDYRSDPLQNSFKISVLSGIFIDYYIAFFISHVISTRDTDISPRAKGLYGSGYYTPGDMTCCVSNF